jgi:hypothetical protein
MPVITQLSTSNTFSQWLTGTQELISKVNSLTDGGNASIFFANTNLEIGNDLTVGGDLTVTGNIILDNIGFNDLFVSGNLVVDNNFSVIGDTLLTELEVTGNVLSINTTTNSFIGQDLFVYRNVTVFDNLNVSGLSTLDNLTVNANTTLSQLQVTGNVSRLNVTSTIDVGSDVYIFGNLVVSGNVTLDALGFDDLNVAGSGTFSNNLTVIGTSEFTGNAEFVNAEVTGTLTTESFVGTANTNIYNTIAASEASALAFAIALG